MAAESTGQSHLMQLRLSENAFLLRPIGGNNVSEQNQSIYENSNYPSRQSPTPEGDPQEPKKGKHPRLGMVGKVLGTLLLIGLCTGVIMCCFLAVYIKTVIVPYADLSLDDFQLGENSIMLYQDKKTGEYKELVTLLSSTKSTWVDHDEIPKYLIDAAVAIEDQRFWEHPGIDWRRTGKAVLDMFMGNDISGGSTITQQLIKNMTDYNETTVKRKITEIVRALRFTKNYSKDETITWYLNIIPLGSGCEGVGSAAFEYFGKPVSELSLAECASLISITNNPSKYGPYSDARSKTKNGELWDSKQWNKYRQELVLGKMLELGSITQEEYDAAVAEELVFVRGEDEEAAKTIYSWYEETVIADVKRDLKEKLEWSDNRISQVLAQGGLRIYTCLDPEVQAVAEKVYTNRANLNYKSASGNLMQSSITIIDNSTGDIAAIVGQFGEKDRNLLKNYANTGKRQPGSSIKPLTVYAPAVEMGLISPATVVDDYPYKMDGDRPWPSNSGTTKYKGMTTVRQGLTHSVNTLAVRIVADKVSPKESFKFAEERFKLDLVDAIKGADGKIMSDRDVAPLAMGGLTQGVSTRDMAEAYATFPNGGIYTQSRTYSKVTMLVDGEEEILLENPPVQETVLKESTAYYMNSMMTDVVRSGTARGHGVNGITSAGKTGTTSNNYDRWFVGYTPYYTAAVWTGYDKGNEPMKTRGNPSLLLWEKVMDQIHKGMKNKSFPVPEGLISVRFCADSGKKTNQYCAMDPRGNRVLTDKVFRDDAPTGTCTVHKASGVVTVCTDSPILDANGKPTGMYHLAGPHCPADHLKQVCLPDIDRKQIGNAHAQDEYYSKAYVESQGTCTVHTGAQPVEPEPEDPAAPAPDTSKPTEPEKPKPEKPEKPEEGEDKKPDKGNGTLEDLGNAMNDAFHDWKDKLSKAG